MLGFFVVGVAVAIAVSMFKGDSQTSNRDQIVNDLNNISAKALQYYRKPQAMAGGGYTFLGFSLLSSDTGNDDGSFEASDVLPAGSDYVPGSIASIATPAQRMYITGCGKEPGSDGVHPVKVYAEITGDSVTTIVLN